MDKQEPPPNPIKEKTMSDTPRTDALAKNVEQIHRVGRDQAILWAASYAELSTTLERELNEAKTRIEVLEGALKCVWDRGIDAQLVPMVRKALKEKS